MNIEHLRYALEVERAGSISQAAKNLFMGQPNLSKAIKELEQALNITIFNRTRRGAELTPKGRDFLRYAKEILHQYEEMEALGQDSNKDIQTLNASVPRSSYIVDAFTSFLADLDMHRPVQIDFYETNALRAVKHVCNGQSGIGVIRCKAEYENYFVGLVSDSLLDWKPLLTGEYLILLGQRHPLADKKMIDIQELSPFLEIIHGDTATPYVPGDVSETERGPTPGDKKVQVYERGSQFDILSRVPGAYMWVSPMPQDLLDRNGLLQKACMQSPSFSDLLIYPHKHTFTALEKKFLEHLYQSVDGILK